MLRTLTKMCSRQFELLIKQHFHLLALNDLAVLDTRASCLYVFKEVIVVGKKSASYLYVIIYIYSFRGSNQFQ